MKPDPHNDGNYIEDDDAAQQAERIGSQGRARLNLYAIQSRGAPWLVAEQPSFCGLEEGHPVNLL